LRWLVKPTSTSGGQLDSHTSHISTDGPQTESQTASSASLTGVVALQPVSMEFFPVEIERPITQQPDTANGPLEDPLTTSPPMIPEKAHHPELYFHYVSLVSSGGRFVRCGTVSIHGYTTRRAVIVSSFISV